MASNVSMTALVIISHHPRLTSPPSPTAQPAAKIERGISTPTVLNTYICVSYHGEWPERDVFIYAEMKGHFDEIFVISCIGSCQNDNFQCSQWGKFRGMIFHLSTLTKFSSLSAPGVVKVTTSGAASDANFVKMATFTFHWVIILWCLYHYHDA